MDPVINSLVQSPLVRSMSTVPSKASSFVHGVRDNVPPFSFNKVVVQAWNNVSTTSQDATHKFRIPQSGTLNRAYLRIKTKNVVPVTKAPTEAHYTTAPSAYTEASTVANAEGNYASLTAQVRMPWVHSSQMKDIPRLGTPLGSGGSPVLLSGSVMNAKGNAAAAAGIHSSALTISDPANKQGKSSNGWNVINVLSEMRLTTNGKTIETVYGETIPAEVVKMPQQLRDFYTKGMVGWACGDHNAEVLSDPDFAQPWDPSACHRDVDGRLTIAPNFSNGYAKQVQLNRNQHANFLVPVTLSSLKTLSKNYQTRFVEDLELEVRMKELARGFNVTSNNADSSTYHTVELVLIYHNWHDNIENTIRNSNYKRGVPASVYSTNWVRAATSVAVKSNALPLTIPLSSRNLVTEICVVAKSKSAGDVMAHPSLQVAKSDYTVLLDRDFKYRLEFTGSGKCIWEGSNYELHGPDTSDYDLSDRRLLGGDSAYGGSDKTARAPYEVHGSEHPSALAGAASKTSAIEYTQGGVDYSFGDNMAILRFGFQTTDEFYSGGVALQTISNPSIVITPPAGALWLDKEIEFDVYVKHANLVRIDSDTGAVTRTLDV